MQLQRNAAKRPDLKPALKILGQPPGPMRSFKQAISLAAVVEDAHAVEASHGTASEDVERSAATPKPSAAVTPVAELSPSNPARGPTSAPDTEQRPGSLMGRLPFGLGRLFRGASA